MDTYILFSNFEDLPKLILVPQGMDIKSLNSINNLARGVDKLTAEQEALFDWVAVVSDIEAAIDDMSEVNGTIINVGWCA